MLYEETFKALTKSLCTADSISELAWKYTLKHF